MGEAACQLGGRNGLAPLHAQRPNVADGGLSQGLIRIHPLSVGEPSLGRNSSYVSNVASEAVICDLVENLLALCRELENVAPSLHPRLSMRSLAW